MPDFWQFPTVSMGLGPIQAIYQARFMKYLESRGFIPAGKQKVWCFMGDGECDEPESLGAISWPAAKLDNLIFVINCNLQRLDGPVRGNAKIIQELEGVFRGAEWNVNKVIWGRFWDPLFAKDTAGLLQQRMDEVIDGEYQNYKAKDGAYVREHFFGARPELLEMVRTFPTRKSGSSTAAATTPTRSMRPTTRRSTTRASRPSSWPRPSRATAPAAAKRRTSRTT